MIWISRGTAGQLEHALSAAERTCRYHGDEFQRFWVRRSVPDCETCRQAYHVSVALASLRNEVLLSELADTRIVTTKGLDGVTVEEFRSALLEAVRNVGVVRPPELREPLSLWWRATEERSRREDWRHLTGRDVLAQWEAARAVLEARRAMNPEVRDRGTS